jgi:glycosyltransferase involved in cell wall biosynthesis
VVDDGSKDNTEAVMAQYTAQDARIRYHKQLNSGPAKARNKGISLAQGDYLQFLDADDLLQPNKIQHQVDILAQQPHVDVVYGPVYYFNTDAHAPETIGELKPDLVNRPKISGQGAEALRAFIISTVCVNAPLVRRQLANQLNMLDETLLQAEDWDFYLRAAHQGAYFHYQENPDGTRALIRKHDSNNTNNFFRLQYYVVKMRQQFATICTDAELLKLNQYWIGKNLEDLIFQIQNDLDNGRRKIAINRSYKAFMLSPSVRYFIYMMASLIASGSMYRKITRFSFTSFFKA